MILFCTRFSYGHDVPPFVTTNNTLIIIFTCIGVIYFISIRLQESYALYENVHQSAISLFCQLFYLVLLILLLGLSI